MWLFAAWRWLWRWVSGSWALVQPRWTAEEIEKLELLNRLRFRAWALRQPRPAMITDMRIALEFGALAHHEPPFQLALDPRRRTHCKPGVPSRLVGRPVIYTFKNKQKIGVTEWAGDYVSRTDRRAAQRLLKASRMAT